MRTFKTVLSLSVIIGLVLVAHKFKPVGDFIYLGPNDSTWQFSLPSFLLGVLIAVIMFGLAVSILISGFLKYRALYRQSKQREDLLTEENQQLSEHVTKLRDRLVGKSAHVTRL